MKYSPTIYAQSLIAVLEDTPPARHGRIIKNFIGVMWKHGAWRAREPIVAAFGRALAEAHGGRIVRIETARVLPQHLQKSIKESFTREQDIVEEYIHPSLIAGVRVSVNGEREFDGSLQRKLKKLF